MKRQYYDDCDRFFSPPNTNIANICLRLMTKQHILMLLAIAKELGNIGRYSPMEWEGRTASAVRPFRIGYQWQKISFLF